MPTTVTGRSKRSSAYDKTFKTHLNDFNIHCANHGYADEAPEPHNLQELHDMLRVPRPSLSPSRITSTFRDFKRHASRANFEADVMQNVIPILAGDSEIHKQQNVLFTEMEPITDETAVKPKPDFFDGAWLRDLNEPLRRDQGLTRHVIPTKHPDVPIAPNFFLEAKGGDGSATVVHLQACYDGAYGARAMSALQNYGNVEPIYDENGYAFSSTYDGGTLKLFAHHMIRPGDVHTRPGHHATELRGFYLRDSEEVFGHGATAFRNARDQAQRYRDDFIQRANMVASQEAPAAETERYGEYNDLEDTAIGAGTLVHDDEALQRHIAEMSSYHDVTDNLESSQSLSREDTSPASPRTSFASQVTPSSGTDRKRPRSTGSPPETQPYRSRLRSGGG